VPTEGAERRHPTGVSRKWPSPWNKLPVCSAPPPPLQHLDWSPAAFCLCTSHLNNAIRLNTSGGYVFTFFVYQNLPKGCKFIYCLLFYTKLCDYFNYWSNEVSFTAKYFFLYFVIHIVLYGSLFCDSGNRLVHQQQSNVKLLVTSVNKQRCMIVSLRNLSQTRHEVTA
jgi:hypothetical protein